MELHEHQATVEALAMLERVAAWVERRDDRWGGLLDVVIRISAGRRARVAAVGANRASIAGALSGDPAIEALVMGDPAAWARGAGRKGR
jgi:hypothetical protein